MAIESKLPQGSVQWAVFLLGLFIFLFGVPLVIGGVKLIVVGGSWYYLPAGGQASPMTYQIDGRQYLVIMTGGHHFMETPIGDQVIAYALPNTG